MGERQNFGASGAIVPDFKPVDHRKQKEISALHAAIVRSQRNYDEKEAEIEKLASDQEALQHDTKNLIEKAAILKNEKHGYDEKTKEYAAKIPDAMQQRDQIREDIAVQEAAFRREYKDLQEQLADVKPIDIPTMIPADNFNAPNIARLKDQMNRIRDQIKSMANNIEKEQELANIRNQKDTLQKQCDQLLKQTNILEHQLSKITEICIEERQKTNSKAAEVDTLESSLNQERKEHDDKLDYLNELYRELYDQWNKLMHDIQEQKRKQREHESIKEELELMKKLLGIHGSFTEEIENVDIDFRKIGGTINEHPNFDPRADAEQLHKAMKGLGTNEEIINEILANRTLKQRREIYRAYNKLYPKKSLDVMIHDDTSGAYRKCLLSLLDNFGTLDARSVKSAIEKRDIIQIVMTLGTRTHLQINQMTTAYHQIYESTLYADIQARFDDPLLLQFMRHLIKGERSVSGSTILKKVVDAEYQVLESHPINTWDRLAVMEEIAPMLTSRSFESIYYLTKICWEDNHQFMDICEAVSKALPDSNFKVALKAYLSLVTNLPARNFARQIHNAIVDKNKDALTYYTISRSELDTTDIKKVYHQMYKIKLQEDIRKMGKGDYERLLISVLTAN